MSKPDGSGLSFHAEMSATHSRKKNYRGKSENRKSTDFFFSLAVFWASPLFTNCFLGNELFDRVAHGNCRFLRAELCLIKYLSQALSACVCRQLSPQRHSQLFTNQPGGKSTCRSMLRAKAKRAELLTSPDTWKSSKWPAETESLRYDSLTSKTERRSCCVRARYPRSWNKMRAPRLLSALLGCFESACPFYVTHQNFVHPVYVKKIFFTNIRSPDCNPCRQTIASTAGLRWKLSKLKSSLCVFDSALLAQ